MDQLPTDPAFLQAMLEGFEAQKSRAERMIAEIKTRLGQPVTQQNVAYSTPVPPPLPSNVIPEIPVSPHKKQRNLSPESRKRIVEAQKKRWAAIKKAQGKK